MDTVVDRVFLDTAFVQGLLNRADELHVQAMALLPVVQAASLVLTTDAVLVEIANALAGLNRKAAADFVNSCYMTPNFEVIHVSSELLMEGLAEYSRYDDKEWSLTDCVSFLVMRQRGVSAAATRDRHFVQAGFTALMA